MAMRNQFFAVALVATLFQCCPLSAQQESLSGRLSLDIPAIGKAEAMPPHAPNLVGNVEGKSVWLAGGLSLLVPGAGQVYAEAPWWRAVVYGAAEVAGWTIFGVYQAKGNDATTAFEQFADQHWDVTRYIGWIEANYQQWSDQQIDKTAAAAALANIYRSDDPAISPWERVDFQELRKLESAVKDDFTHTLPNHGEQQYYEQIGKYVQYRAGWDDHIAEGDTAIYNPSRVTQRNHDYTLLRLDANDLLSYAQTGITIVAINHIVSMLDAALTAHAHNIRIKSELKGLLQPNGELEMVPVVRVGVGF
ncbi:MAG: hypothetical protein DYG96_13425 [Chlorobi bacterium CHB2]|nr:hypothetical protein [Chlorobi bacterium CHB2]